MRRLSPFLAACLLVLAAPGAGAQDGDGDGVPDGVDNCVGVANPGQVDSDHDRFGNACDGDLDQSGIADAVDRTLLAGEVGASRPRALGDLDGDGSVDDADVAWFDDRLVGRAPGPAGDRAHDLDGDGFLDVCELSGYESCMAACAGPFADCHASCDADALPYRHRRDGAAPQLIANGSVDGTPPPGWSSPNSPYVAVAGDVGRTRGGAFQWLTWGGAGHGGDDACGGSCIQPDPSPVRADRSYAFSYYTCTAEFPPTTLTLTFSEHAADGAWLRNVGPSNNSKVMNSAPGTWEENVFFYRPTDDSVATVRPKVFRKTGPAWARGTIWADDFALWELDESGTRTYRAPASRKRAFEGRRTRVDELGNLSVRRDDRWQDVIPFGIHAHLAQDYSVYVDVGFDVVMNERGFGAEARPGIDASSPLVPDGMWFLFVTNRWTDPEPTALQLEAALQTLRTGTSPVRGIRLWDRLLGFNYDNEIFSRCGETDDVSGECLQRTWDAARAPLARIFEVDREENGGLRGVPSYFLNGNPGVARAYVGPAAAVDAEGDVRSDVTGSYGAANIDHLEKAQHQVAPTLVVQVQSSVGDRYRSLAFGGLALGAKMVGTWRDWPPSGPDHGVLRTAPALVLCGATDFGLRARGNYFAAPGQLVEGADSGARAEILDGPVVHGDCPAGDGATYEVHLRGGTFAPGESLLDAGSGAPIADATVLGVSGSGLVDYEVTITERGWYGDVAALRREVDALAPILRASHWTDWAAPCVAVEPSGNAVPFGDDGFVVGTRTHGGEAYLLLSNTRHELRAESDWDRQYVGVPLRLDLELQGLTGRPVRVRPFDPTALAFSDDGSLPVVDGRLKVDLPPLGTAAFHVVVEHEPPSGASEVLDGMAPMLVTDHDPLTGRLGIAYEPACHATEHAVLEGALASVSTHAVDTIHCGLTDDGLATVNLTAGDRFFTVVGRAPVGEGSAGRDSFAVERPAPEPTLPCAVVRALGACP